ncbi:hypothetical protein MMC22_001493 [Lobaria immixta]|nr:hypothetical protein [Lobaria immixta]
MARGPAEREVANIPEPKQRSDDGGQDEGVSILPMFDKASNDEKDSQRSDADGEDFHNPQGIDSEEDFHSPELPASSSGDELRKSHDKGEENGEGNLKSPPATPETLFPPTSFHPLRENYEGDNKSDFGYNSDDDNDNTMSHPLTLSLAEASRIKHL